MNINVNYELSDKDERYYALNFSNATFSVIYDKDEKLLLDWYCTDLTATDYTFINNFGVKVKTAPLSDTRFRFILDIIDWWDSNKDNRDKIIRKAIVDSFI